MSGTADIGRLKSFLWSMPGRPDAGEASRASRCGGKRRGPAGAWIAPQDGARGLGAAPWGNRQQRTAGRRGLGRGRAADRDEHPAKPHLPPSRGAGAQGRDPGAPARLSPGAWWRGHRCPGRRTPGPPRRAVGRGCRPRPPGAGRAGAVARTAAAGRCRGRGGLDHPFDEQLHRHLIVALYRNGRQADALAAYQRLRRTLTDDLGIDPSQALRDLQAAILRQEPALELAPPPIPMPRQLPAPPQSFTGRAQELAQLDAIAATADNQPVVVVVAAISGSAGVGKSALVIHAANRLAKHFPDGQLYINLQGATAGMAPLEPLEVLGRFLRALGVSGDQVPAGVDEATARFRSELADQRLLVVLDNAADTDQVLPLLPGQSGCAALITSRRVLAGLYTASHLHLDVLAAAEAIELLGRLAGKDRIAAEPEATSEVAQRCGWLPLALRIAGARLAARPGWPVRALAERLTDATRRLEELEASGLAVRASFEVSLHALQHSGDTGDQAAARAFGLLGLSDGPDLSLT